MTQTILTASESVTLARAGGDAPSGGNMQPWRVRMHTDAMEIWLDDERSSSFLDVDRRASVFSLGSFAENVVLAASELGLRAKVEVAETIDLERPLARIAFVRDATLEAHPLAARIAERGTNRKPHTGPTLDESVLATLHESMRHGTRLHARSSDEDRRTAAQILGEGDVLRIRNPRMNREMWSEVRWTPDEVEATRDGVDIATLEVPESAVAQLQMFQDHDFVTRNVPDEAIIGMATASILASSHVCVLSVEPDAGAATWFDAGRDMQHMWLRAADLGLALQPWTALTFAIIRADYFGGEGLSEHEIATSMSLLFRLRILFDIPESRIPLFLFRLSRAEAPSARSLRRHVADYMTLDK